MAQPISTRHCTVRWLPWLLYSLVYTVKVYDWSLFTAQVPLDTSNVNCVIYPNGELLLLATSLIMVPFWSAAVRRTLSERRLRSRWRMAWIMCRRGPLSFLDTIFHRLQVRADCRPDLLPPPLLVGSTCLWTLLGAIFVGGVRYFSAVLFISALAGQSITATCRLFDQTANRQTVSVFCDIGFGLCLSGFFRFNGCRIYRSRRSRPHRAGS